MTDIVSVTLYLGPMDGFTMDCFATDLCVVIGRKGLDLKPFRIEKDPEDWHLALLKRSEGAYYPPPMGIQRVMRHQRWRWSTQPQWSTM